MQWVGLHNDRTGERYQVSVQWVGLHNDRTGERYQLSVKGCKFAY